MAKATATDLITQVVALIKLNGWTLTPELEALLPVEEAPAEAAEEG